MIKILVNENQQSYISTEDDEYIFFEGEYLEPDAVGYAVYCINSDSEGYILHKASLNDPDKYSLINPKLTLEDNASGTFSFTVPVTNAGYSGLHRLTSRVIIKKDGKEIFEGRVIEESMDFWKNRSITCEGELGYLNDTTQPMGEFHDISPRDFLNTMLTAHNAKVEDYKKFLIGTVTVEDPIQGDELYRYTNRESTLSDILDKLTSRLGGHLIIRKEEGIRYLDYLEEWPHTTTQTIEFGKNLMDYTSNYELTDLATVLLPLGEMLEDSPIEALTDYLTVEEVNQGSPYVVNQEAKDIYGWIEKVIHWDDVTLPENLLTKAQKYLQDYQFDNMTLEVTVADLHLLNPDIQELALLDQVLVISKPHGLNKVFPVTKMTIPLDKPEETTYILGTKNTSSFTASVRQASSEAASKLDERARVATDQATAEATRLITNATNGYITIVTHDDHSQELYISDTVNYESAQKKWRWNINGLGYSNDGGATYGLAMTMDGTIVADYIRAGVIRDRSGDDKVVIDLDNGAVSIKGDIYATSFIVDEEIKVHSVMPDPTTHEPVDYEWDIIKIGEIDPGHPCARLYLLPGQDTSVASNATLRMSNSAGLVSRYSMRIEGDRLEVGDALNGVGSYMGKQDTKIYQDLTAGRYVKAVYFNSSTTTHQNPASYTSYVPFFSSDGYLRKSTLANFKTWFGAATSATSATKATYATLNYLGSTSSSTAKNFTINANCTEIVIAANFSTKLFCASVPKNLLNTTAKEVWVGGGKGESNASAPAYATRCLCNVTLVNSTTVQVKGVAANNEASNTLASTTFYVYQR